MVFDEIEKNKAQYSDKYVVVDAERPELARFKGRVGQVKTVNMSGRALVQFLDYHLNIGWYDIELDYLKIVDQPPPQPEKAEKKPKPAAKAPTTAKPTTTQGLSALELARMQGPAKKDKEPAKTPASKMSVADVLAAARAEKSGAAKETRAKGEPASLATVEKTAPNKTEPPAKLAKTDRSKMSVADILAAASAPSSSEKIDRSTMSVEDILAWCRKHDARG